MTAPSRSDMTLQQYLDSLLKPVSRVEPAAFAEPPAPLPVPLPPATPPVLATPARTGTPQVAPPPQIAERETPTHAIAGTKADGRLSSSALPPVDAATAAASADTARPAPWANGRPAWAQSNFESLLFTVGGLNLAVPLVELGSIHMLGAEDVSPLFGQAEWFMGLVAGPDGGTIRVIDTAQVVMAERWQPEMRGGYRYLITLNGTDWGLAVDRVAAALTLRPDQVRWRGARTQRQWLAGTVVDHMCALLDPGQLGTYFQQQDRLRRAPARRLPRDMP